MMGDAKQMAASSTTLAPGLHEAEMEVKKSRFIGYAQHVTTWKEAQDFLNIIKEEHPKSRHIAFGFVAGSNPVQERCSDDGEPTGTAGLPVLGEFCCFT
jgi:putative IMPACT (imprinted ancient) family translation regulator